MNKILPVIGIVLIALVAQSIMTLVIVDRTFEQVLQIKGGQYGRH